MRRSRLALVALFALLVGIGATTLDGPPGTPDTIQTASATRTAAPQITGPDLDSIVAADAVAHGAAIAEWVAGVERAEEERRVAEWVAGVERAQAEAAAAARRSAPRVSSSGGAVVTDGDAWSRLAACECGGNPACNTGNGYYGTFQFSLPTWRSVGGEGLPSAASDEEQLARAQALQARSGWGQWPGCSAKLGLR
jgi:hypothetical protein